MNNLKNKLVTRNNILVFKTKAKFDVIEKTSYLNLVYAVEEALFKKASFSIFITYENCSRNSEFLNIFNNYLSSKNHKIKNYDSNINTNISLDEYVFNKQKIRFFIKV